MLQCPCSPAQGNADFSSCSSPQGDNSLWAIMAIALIVVFAVLSMISKAKEKKRQNIAGETKESEAEKEPTAKE
jgi:hypothetical protein